MAIPLGLILGGAQLAGGIIRGITGKKRPHYEVPQEDKAALAAAKMQAADPLMPGQSAMEDQISLATANALAASRESGSVGENIAGIQAEENRAKRELGIAAAQDQKQDILNYQRQLGVMGQKKDLQFQMNEFAPHAQGYQESRQMLGAGVSNLSNAFQTQQIMSLLKKPDTSGLGSTSINSPLLGSSFLNLQAGSQNPISGTSPGFSNQFSNPWGRGSGLYSALALALSQ